MANEWISLTGADDRKIEKLLVGEFKTIPTTNQYETRRLKNEDVLIIQYTSGKTVVQGKEKYAQFIADFIGGKAKEQEQKDKDTENDKTIIGSDETLKGDTFGGMVVAAVKADKDTRKRLEDIGVKDSKQITDTDIITLAKKIKEILGKDNYCIYEKTPETYNQHTGNTTQLLNAMHTRVLKTLGDADLIMIDQYPGARINLKNAKTETKAESNYTEVAAASILAREQGLKQLDRLTEQAGFKVPKGSTHVKDALLRIKKENKDPNMFVKMNFRNVKKVFD
ncbi:MAG: hypothetical protein KAI18_00310 [Candidatus Aenigmarchaeota archaeon]|nr:hypothetical protein [Candidatus Aenigmarchaeota archaeon]